MRRSRVFSILAPAAAALAFAAPGAAIQADDYDMDCKLLLCLPGGFPDGCGDALDHMVDRIRDGKSPIGTCLMSGGGEYDDYDIHYALQQRDITQRMAVFGRQFALSHRPPGRRHGAQEHRQRVLLREQQYGRYRQLDPNLLHGDEQPRAHRLHAQHDHERQYR